MRTRILTLIFAASCVAAANAQVVVRYEAPGSVFTPTIVDSNATANDLNTSGSAAMLEPGNTLPNSVFVRASVGSANGSEAVANAQFVQFTVEANAGYGLNLNSFEVEAAKGGSSDPRGWLLRSSLDGYTADLGGAIVPTIDPTLTAFSLDLTGFGFNNVTGPLTFRIYSFTPANGAGIFYDNITLNGTVEAVPEPATMAALGLGALALLRRRKRA